MKNQTRRHVKRRNGIKTKLIGTIVPVVVVSILAILLVSFNSSKESIVDKTESLVQAETQAVLMKS